MQIHIKCHRPDRNYQSPHFFILSKGLNAGKPLDKPCPNCFVVITTTHEQRDQLYWLSFGLWQIGYYRQHLVGSVVQFIHIGDLRSGLRQNWMKIYTDVDGFLKSVAALNNLFDLQKRLNDQLANAHKLKVAIIRNALRSEQHQI